MDIEHKLARLEERIDALELDFDLLKDKFDSYRLKHFNVRVDDDGIVHVEPCWVEKYDAKV